MRHSGHVTNFAQNLGELVGHDILLMRLSDPVERERVKAEVGTEHIVVRRWFRRVVERANLLLRRGAKASDPDACCGTASGLAPIDHAHRVGQTPPASRHANVLLPPEHHFEQTAHA